MTLFRRTLFSIFNLATFLTSSSISSSSMSVWQEAKTDFFLLCLCFFSVGEELTLLSLHGKVQSRSFKATSDDTRGLFAGNFRPLSPLKFLFPLSDIILLVHSDLLWVEYRWKRPVYYLFHPTQGLHDVFGVEMLRTYVLVAVGWNFLSARRKRCSISFEAFSYSEERKS